jgi:hypothetical protein
VVAYIYRFHNIDTHLESILYFDSEGYEQDMDPDFYFLGIQNQEKDITVEGKSAKVVPVGSDAVDVLQLKDNHVIMTTERHELQKKDDFKT